MVSRRSQLLAALTAKRAALLRAALRHVHNLALAEEVLQETCVAALRGLHRFQARSSLETWLFGILHNQARKKRAREGRTIPRDALDVASSDGAPDRELLARELRARIGAAIDGLPRNQRAVVCLHHLEGLSSPEICERLAISESNRRVLLHRAHSRLRAALARYLMSGDATG